VPASQIFPNKFPSQQGMENIILPASPLKMRVFSQRVGISIWFCQRVGICIWFCQPEYFPFFFSQRW